MYLGSQRDYFKFLIPTRRTKMRTGRNIAPPTIESWVVEVVKLRLAGKKIESKEEKPIRRTE